MRIRILHVVDHLGYGGAPFVVKNIVERTPEDRFESLVCALRSNPKSIPIRGDVTSLQCRRYSPAAIRAIADLCKSRQIDIVHAHLQKAIVSSLLAKSLYKGRLVIHEHGAIFRGGTGCVYRRLLWLFGPRADAIIANSAAAKSALQRALRKSAGPVTVIDNFIDLERFTPDRYDRTAARASLGLADGEFVIGFVGRLDRAKGADLLIDAAAILKEKDDSWRFVVVGDGPERRHLEDQARKLSLGGTVVFTGLQENTAAVMRAFDAGVVPSRREAFGIAALEMMRMKVPVIVSPVGGLPELVRQGQTGIVLPQPAPQPIAESIRQLARDGTLRARLCRNAFEHASSFDGSGPMRQIVELYEQLTSSGGTQR
jgi:glycosyltransferase involved in cell wall biosynthesis